MHIHELYGQKKPVISFEVFPPKKEADISTVYTTLEKLAGLEPDFISVTYGAGGAGSVNRTCEIASRIKNHNGVEALAHLTCITADRQRIRELVAELKRENIENILAMRGDPPAGMDQPPKGSYSYASQLIHELRELGDFSIGAACYPEGHIECEEFEDSLTHLLEKQQAGADFLVTQLFFDNNLFWNFLDKARAKGIHLPISAGVMPILSRSQVERMIFLCGASLPSDIIKLLHRYADAPSDLRKAGVEYAIRQMEALVAGGVDGIHVYTMNQPGIASSAIGRIGNARA